MGELEQILSQGDLGPMPLKRALLSLLLAFVLSQGIAAVYAWTFRGMSYARSFVQAVAAGGVVSAMLMLALNNSLAAAIGIAGSLAFIRFRTSLRDPRDMVFIFAAMGAGIASGLGAWTAAIGGAVVFSAAMVLLTVTEFGSQQPFDGLLRFRIRTDGEEEERVAAVLRRHTRSFALVTLREVAQGAAMEHAYQIRLPDPGRRSQLLSELRAVGEVEDLSLLLQDSTVEL